MKLSNLHHKYSLGNANKNALKKEILAVSKLDDFCIICGNQLVPYMNAVPYEKTFIKIPGKYCINCGQFYATKCNELFTAVRHNKYAKGFSIFLPDTIPEGQRKAISYFYKNNSSMLLLKLKNISTGEISFITITKDTVSPFETVFSYNEKEIRKILSVLKGKIECRTVEVGNNKFEIIESFSNQQKDYLNDLMIDRIFIGQNGGLYNSKNDSVIVHLLVFSSVTKNYELLKATYDAEYKIYYTDSTFFRAFLKKYGKPDIPIAIHKIGQRDDKFLLNDESILSIFGYNVNAKNALSETHRHKILSEIMDYRFASASEIIRILQSNISLRPQAKYIEAKKKWIADIEFVQNYKSEPSEIMLYKNNI